MHRLRPRTRPAAATARPTRLRHLLTGALAAPAVLLATVAMPSAAAAAPTGGAAPHGWFLQVSSLAPTYSVPTVTEWVAAACQLPVAQRPALVLQDVAGADGALATPYLDAIAPYLPGGRYGCISKLYVGTYQPTWTGAGSLYVDAVQDPNFRTTYLSTSKSLAGQFARRYPGLKYDWYLSYEADLNEFYYSDVASAYASLFKQEESALALVHNGGFLWSPAFWFPYSAYHTNTAGMTGLAQQLNSFFGTLRGTGKAQALDLQDFVSGSSCQPPGNQVTPTDAASWLSFVKSLAYAPPTTLNVELYQMDCSTGGMTAADPSDISARMATYSQWGVPLGPAFELRYRSALS